MKRKTKIETIIQLMRRPQGVSRYEIWFYTHAYKNFAMDKLVRPHKVKYLKRKVDGVIRYYAK